MSVKYKYSGLTKELYQRLVSEHAALREAYKKGSYKQYFQEVRQCSEVQARIILKYRTKGKIGHDKKSVRKALYTAYALGV